jgi:hypothetical protein
MTNEELQGGNYSAKAVDCWIMRSGDKGTLGACIEFKLTDHNKKVRWTGWLTDAAKGRTIDSLLSCGFIGNRVADLANGISMLDSNLVVDLSCKVEEYTNNSGKIIRYLKANFINTGAAKDKLEYSEAVQAFKGMEIDGELIRQRKERGIKTPPRQETQYTPNTDVNFSADDIPF